MNTNPPMDQTPFEDNLIVIHIDKINKTCLVRNERGGKSFTCELADRVVEGIMLMDYVQVKRTVTGKRIVTDYFVNQEFYNEDYYTEVLV